MDNILKGEHQCDLCEKQIEICSPSPTCWRRWARLYGAEYVHAYTERMMREKSRKEPV